MTESTLIERIRMHPRSGDEIISASGAVVRVLDIGETAFGQAVAVLIVPPGDKPSREKLILLKQWREACGWERVIEATGGGE